MKKHIFVIQSEFDMGRGRDKRRLEASLDKNNSGLNNIFPPDYFCPYSPYCNVRKFGRINCLTEYTIKTCQTYKYFKKQKKLIAKTVIAKTGLQRFIDKYGENWREMFIGSKK
jgi:hypothetical protein